MCYCFVFVRLTCTCRTVLAFKTMEIVRESAMSRQNLRQFLFYFDFSYYWVGVYCVGEKQLGNCHDFICSILPVPFIKRLLTDLVLDERDRTLVIVWPNFQVYSCLLSQGVCTLISLQPNMSFNPANINRLLLKVALPSRVCESLQLVGGENHCLVRCQSPL